MRLDHGARNACGSFGLQGDGAVALVHEGIHFLLNNVGRIAHAPLEKLGVFEDRGADFAVSAQRTHAAHGIFDFMPAMAVLGKHILGALRRLSEHKNCHLPSNLWKNHHHSIKKPSGPL